MEGATYVDPPNLVLLPTPILTLLALPERELRPLVHEAINSFRPNVGSDIYQRRARGLEVWSLDQESDKRVL